MTEKTPTEPSATHQLPIRVGQETQQSSFTKPPVQQPIAVQPLQTRTGHSWRPVTESPVPATGRGHSWQALKRYPASSTGSGHSWQALKGHPASSTGSGHSWQALEGQPASPTESGHSWQAEKGRGRGHSWQAVKGKPVSSPGSGHSWKPVVGIPSQLHVIEPVNRSWKTGREGAITCELCAYTTERKEKYVEHLQCHITQRYMCKICGRACLKVKIFIIFFHH